MLHEGRKRCNHVVKVASAGDNIEKHNFIVACRKREHGYTKMLFLCRHIADGRRGTGSTVLKGSLMIKVKLRGNETAEQMLRRFKKACEKEGLTKDIKRVAYYEKPSEKRRRRIRKSGPRPLMTAARSR